jgi:hypothetical protein
MLSQWQKAAHPQAKTQDQVIGSFVFFQDGLGFGQELIGVWINGNYHFKVNEASSASPG